MSLTDRTAAFCAALSSRGIEYRRDEPLSRHTSFRIGGAASVAVFPSCGTEMADALSEVRRRGIPYFVVGGGSNLLAPDDGFDGAVIFTTAMRSISFREASDGTMEVTADAGVPLSVLAKQAAERGLTGAEFLYGIPGTVGGAVVMNAGAYGGEIAQILLSSRYLDVDAREHARDLAGHAYGYRRSVYLAHPEETVLSAVLRLKKGDREAIKMEMERLITQRKEKQPLEYPSAGSFFKRPEGAFAGKLIEDCGLKGFRIGGAEVSVKHAGFLVNRGGATEADVRALAAYVRATVKEQTGYLLESEVRPMKGAEL